jgi:lipopolysaccharide transport system permease protein
MRDPTTAHEATMSDTPRTAHPLRIAQRSPLFTVSADRGWIHRFRLAATDFRDGARLWRLSWALAVTDIRLRYRGSVLGPFWLTLSTAIMIGSMAFLYAALFHTDIHSYLPFLAVSIILWNYLGALVGEGCTCFIQADSLVKNTRMPFTVHALRSVIRNTIILAHNAIVVIALYIIMGRPVSLYALWAIPGLLVWWLDAIAISLLLGAVCARFRDIPQIVASIMQIAFFLTPVMWYPDILQGHPGAFMLIRFNPFFYLLEAVRAPLLGTALGLSSMGKIIIVSTAIVAVSGVGFIRSRGRIAYWI